ncbi:MAG: IS5 family transposase [Pseudomonadota bacterium]
MDTSRFVIRDHQWVKMEPHCLGLKAHPGRTGSDARLFMEAIFWIARTGSPWRDLPPGFGNWNTLNRRFRDWARAGVFERIFNALSDQPDMEMAMIDGMIVKVHRAGQGAKGGLSGQAIGKSNCGWTTKILALTDALGNLVRFMLLPGNRYDTVGVAPLIKGLSFDALLADKAFDSNWIIDEMNVRGASICIAQHTRRKDPLQIDDEMYKWRHLAENFFCNLKDFRRIALRTGKTDLSFAAIINTCAALLNTR